MASDLDTLLAETLDDRAGGDIDPAPLMRAAVRRGRRIRRRRTIGCAAALVTVVAFGTAAMVVPGSNRDAAPVVAAPGVVLADRPALLPAAPGQPGAAARPDLIGTDARVLHFSVDRFAGTATEVTWTAEPGSEQAEVRADTFEAHVAVARTPDMLGASINFTPGAGGFGSAVDVRVAGQAGTLRRAVEARGLDGLALWSVQWQPGAGVWAKADVWAPARTDAERVAGLVRFDVAQRCVLPFTLTSLPSGLTVRSCTVTLSVDRVVKFFRGTLDVGDGRREVSVQVLDAPTTEPFVGGLPAGPYRVRHDDAFYIMVVPPYLVQAEVRTSGTPVARDQVLRMLAGLRTRGEPGDPNSW